MVSHLKQAYEEIWVDQPEDNWSAVAHRCDDALEAFADIIWKEEYADRLKENPPPRNKYVDRLDQVIRANGDSKELRDLLAKLQKYVAARRHDPRTTHEEAKRVVLYTYLLIAEIYELLNPVKTSEK
ncbi:MAG: hypothetical protein IH955_10240 [Chloroflexi bacterium]|nr:hypothetical protein [Chloroflexota bacterium]